MPKVSEFFGIAEESTIHLIFMPAKRRREGVFSISPLGYLHGDLTPRAIALVIEWAAMHGVELENSWKLAR